jgi:purine-binding chemotaxis protein CheW
MNTSLAGSAERHLCVVLGAEHYAINILKIHEIQGYAPPSPVPRMPSYVRGMMNLHGAIVSVIDLRLRLDLPEAPYTKTTVIVFVRVQQKIVGLVVDAATSVIDIAAADVAPPPEIGSGIDASFMAGIAKLKDRIVILLDTDALLAGDAAAAAEKMGQE